MRELKRNHGLWLLAFIVLAALLAPLLASQNPYDLAQIDVLDARLPPAAHSSAGHARYLLGTDEQGRDMLSAILYGLRISLGVGVAGTSIALLLGTALGLVAGYFGGWIDRAMMRLADLQLSFPALLIALVLLAVMGPGLGKVVTALALVQWAYFARTTRSVALVESAKDYVAAAQLGGLSSAQILLRHLLPNCLPTLLTIVPLQVAAAISLEATLSFLGLGAPVTEPSLGLLVANGFQYLHSGKYWISFFPGLALLITVAAVNLVGERMALLLSKPGRAESIRTPR